MAWIESHQELGDHPKTRKLAQLLDVSIPTALGHLHCLWWWALSYADDGELGNYDNVDLALAARWDGDPEAFVKALITCGPGSKAGFVNDDMSLHDWDQYAGKLVERRRKDRERKATSRATPTPVRGTSDGHPQDTRGKSTPVREDGARTQPTQPTEPTKSASRSLRGRARAGPIPDDWQPKDKHREIATDEAVHLEAEAERFRDDALAKGKTFKDWDRAFNNWLRSDYAKKPANGHTNGQVVRLTAAEQRTQRNRENIEQALAEQREWGLQ